MPFLHQNVCIQSSLKSRTKFVVFSFDLNQTGGKFYASVITKLEMCRPATDDPGFKTLKQFSIYPL
jgi:hypothetical protein